ncbi:MAG: STAS domain-containing protein [Oscillochloris sp.]|nr:STAS domain-containing protein [Oscillochloris sp.]
MEIHTTTVEDLITVQLSGDLDGKTVPVAQERIVLALQSGSRLILDMREVGYMSSAGLRMLLLLQRQITTLQGRLVLLGLTDDLKDTMSATGFLSHFTTVETPNEALAVLD